jgi:hypothetical protein
MFLDLLPFLFPSVIGEPRLTIPTEETERRA